MRTPIFAISAALLVCAIALTGCKDDEPAPPQREPGSPGTERNTQSKAEDTPQERSRQTKSLSGSFEVRLAPNKYDGRHRLNWSPYGKRHKLVQAGDALETEIRLGPEGLKPISARLEKSDNSKDYDILKVDGNRNGSFEEAEVLKTTPRVTRGSMWSSFKTVVDLPVTDPWTGNAVISPYSMSLWYVEDPNRPSREKVLRFSRGWWLEGNVKLGDADCLIIVSEREMDGIIDEKDRWSLAPAADPAPAYKSANAQSITKYGWLGEQAYRITQIHPSGRKLIIEPCDPGITIAEDLIRRDRYSADRNVPRSGKTVTFLQDFEKAQALAREQNKPLFIHFTATWCGPCKMMEQLVYSADAVVKAAQNVVALKVDSDEQPELKTRLKAGGLPGMILLSPEGVELKKAGGYMGVKEMTAFLNSNPPK